MMRRKLLAAILMLLFGVAFAHAQTATPPITPTPELTLRVITFNVYSLNQRPEDVALWLREQNADLVLLQEISDIQAPTLTTNLLDIYPYQAAENVDNGSIAVLSRYPILSAEMFTINAESGAQQRLTLDVNGQIIAVYNIHVANPIGELAASEQESSNPLIALGQRYDATERNNGIRSLLERLAAEPYPYIVTGDFNMGDNDVMHDEMAAVMGDSFDEAGEGSGATWPAESADEPLPDFLPPLLRIDYIWHSAHFRAAAAEVGPELGSDHLPVLATLQIFSVG